MWWIVPAIGTAYLIYHFFLKCPKIPFTQLYPIVKQLSDFYEIEPAIIFAIIEQESGFCPTAVRYERKFWERNIKNNPKYADNPFKDDYRAWGSWGLMQVLYSTALELGMPKNVSPAVWLTDPVNNLKIGVKYLRLLFEKYKNLQDVIAHYNGGEYAVRQKRLTGKYPNEHYVRNVLKFHSKWSRIFWKEK